MNRNEAHVVAGANEDKDLPIMTAVSGALIGAMTGIVGGVLGVGLGAVAGAVFGTIGGLALQRQRQRLDVLESDDDAAWAALIEPPRTEEDDELHVRQHPTAHLHYAYPASFGVGSMLIRP
jgi:hypothetical protein